MAAVSIPPPSPHAIGIMATRRIALAENPNLGNSPYHHRTALTPVKRGRSRSVVDENTPPHKKQVLDDQHPPRTPARRVGPARKAERGPDRQIVGRTTKQERVEAEPEPVNSILQWQKHYRKIFPSYVLYFENIPEEARRRCVRGIEMLGAREVKFFSKDVTHVITTRSVPTEEELSQSIEQGEEVSGQEPRTINPSLLDRTAETSTVPRGKFNFELASTRRVNAPVPDFNARRPVQKVDILQKARDLNIKIWQLEKLVRVLKTIFDDPKAQDGHNTRAAAAKNIKPVDLHQMIKNELIHERGDREINNANTELVRMTGPYIYVHCMNEKTKPILVREYPKVQKKEDGEWPQFRSATAGKCPFVEDESNSRRGRRRDDNVRQAAAQAKAKAQQAQARAPMQPPILRPRREVLIERTGNTAPQAFQLPPPPAQNDPTFTKGKEQPGQHIGRRFINGEPTASGVQPSNITSAIRSQMISSTAAAPGIKAGTSKEVYGLQRKAVERNIGLQQSQRMPNLHGGIGRGGAAPVARMQPMTIPGNTQQVATRARSKAAERHHAQASTKEVIKEDKPGYCENCREKYADFDEHIAGRRHRKFAVDANNWIDLDNLLSTLVRPLKAEVEW